MTDFSDLLDIFDPDKNYFENQFDCISSTTQSNYINIFDFHEIPLSSSKLRLISYNIRSFAANSDTMFAMLNNGSFPDILCLSETWFTSETTQDIDGCTCYHVTRPTRRSGGVSVYVRNSIQSELVSYHSYCSDVIEICTVKIVVGDFSCFILAIYRPHSGSINDFITVLNSILSDSKISKSICFLAGDLNINLLNESQEIIDFFSFMYSSHFVPIVTKPTRFPSNNDQHTPSLIDHIWINRIDIPYECFIILSDFTDHCPLFLQIEIPKSQMKYDEKVLVKFRDINDLNMSNFERVLSSFNWVSIVNDDMNVYVGNFLSTLNELFRSTFPLKTKYISKKSFQKPWVNSNIKKIDLCEI